MIQLSFFGLITFLCHVANVALHYYGILDHFWGTNDKAFAVINPVMSKYLDTVCYFITLVKTKQNRNAQFKSQCNYYIDLFTIKCVQIPIVLYIRTHSSA